MYIHVYVLKDAFQTCLTNTQGSVQPSDESYLSTRWHVVLYSSSHWLFGEGWTPVPHMNRWHTGGPMTKLKKGRKAPDNTMSQWYTLITQLLACCSDKCVALWCTVAGELPFSLASAYVRCNGWDFKFGSLEWKTGASRIVCRPRLP